MYIYKMNKEVTNESFNNRQSITDSSNSVHDASISKYRPLKVTELQASDSEDEESDAKENYTEDDEEKDVIQPIDKLKLTDKQTKKLVTQTVSTKSSSSSSIESNVLIKTSPPIQSTNSALNWQNYSKDKQISNDKKSPINLTQSTHTFTTDFVKMDIDELPMDFVHSCKTSVDQTNLKSDHQVSSKQLSTSSSLHCENINRHSNEKADAVHISQDKQIHGKNFYKVDNSLLNNHNLINKIDQTVTNVQYNDNHQIANSTQINQETPMKHQPAVGSMRPMPSHSHRSIFQTPQSKIQSDHHIAQTPSTILSMWSQNPFLRTPLQTRGSSDIATGQTPNVSNVHKTQTSNSWYRNNDGHGVRRPLVETIPSDHRITNDNSHTHSKIKKEHIEKTEPSSRRALELVHEIPQPISTQENPRKMEIKQEFQDNNHHKSSPPSNQDLKNTNHHHHHHHYHHQQQQTNSELKENQYPLSNTLDTIKKQTNHQKNISIEPTSVASVAPVAPSVIPSALPQKYNDDYQNKQKNQPKPCIQASVTTHQPERNDKYIDVRGKNYLILGNLGKGMSGEVYRVQDIETSELRAIKIVNLKKMDKESAKSSIEEVELLKKLQAPCVIKMYNCDQRDGKIYTVMEMGDTDLSRFLREVTAEKRLPLTMILYYWTEMLTAVKYIHDNGVIHSDLKPANFLLVRGRLKLIDFGISSTLNADMTSVIKNSTVGTLNYISPEALVDVNDNPDNNDASPNHKVKYKINFKSDVWSLGCILYSMIYGKTPYSHINAQWKKIHAISDESDNISFKLSSNSPPIPSILIDVIRKCLQKNPKARPSVKELLQIEYTSLGKTKTNPPSISPNILRKIKGALDDDEWREFCSMYG